jgi:hypothetical protein
MGHPFSRSYGVNLPSSLTAFLSSALGYSPRPPVSVLVRTPSHYLEDFLVGQSGDFAQKGSPSLLGLRIRIYLYASHKLGRTSFSAITFPSASPHRS